MTLFVLDRNNPTTVLDQFSLHPCQTLQGCYEQIKNQYSHNIVIGYCDHSAINRNVQALKDVYTQLEH